MRSLFLAVLILLTLITRSASALPISFGTETLIIPMDTDTSGQDSGMLRAYGLVYDLLRHGVPVSWTINPGKPANGDDFTVAAAGALEDVRTGATIAPRSYRGGPFLIAAADAAAALPLIQAWQAVPGDQTAVHELVSASSISVDVSRVLLSAPRIAILKDGNETIAFNDLNAAGIPDATGAAWTASSPGLLTETDVEGPTTTTDDDGALFVQPSGQPRYCFLAAMHYNDTSHTPEVVQEVRHWLDRTNLGHAFMQCEAARVFENSTGGLFLTTTGLDDDGSAPSSSAIRVPSSPLAQLDGAFEVDSGSVDSMAPHAPGFFKAGVTTLINDNASALNQRIVMLTGRLDGDNGNSQVTYLAGHDYALDLPITSNPQTNGVRLFLNALLTSDCATVGDNDLDGYIPPGDCNDGDPAIHPGATDIPGDSVDQDCDGHALCFSDADGDGFGAAPTVPSVDLDCIPNSAAEHIAANDADCDDLHATVHPGATEVCDPSNIDEDCDGLADDLDPQGDAAGKTIFYTDFDHDGHGTGPGTTRCDPLGTMTASVGDDCDDTNDASYPGATEVCDPGNVDEDCDGLADDLDPQGAIGRVPRYVDNDGDGYGAGAQTLLCHGASVSSDCNDADSASYPGAIEVTGDGVDENCDGHEVCFLDADLDGYRTDAVVSSVDADCSDPGEAGVGAALDCDDAHASAHPGGTEVCDPDDVDEDCDGAADDNDPDAAGKTTFYVDLDGDGYGAVGGSIQRCDAAPGYVNVTGDCDDANADIHPSAEEHPADFVDQDCDGHELCFADADDDGARTETTVQSADLDCTDTFEAATAAPIDCDDGNPGIHPGATEACSDAADNDCNGAADCDDTSCAADSACGAGLCSGGPFSCKNPGSTQFDLRNASKDSRDKIAFRWALGDPTTAAELGDPTVDTRYAVCVWDDVAGTPTLVMEAAAPPAGNCIGRPCWRALGDGDGFRYRDPGRLPSGLDQLTLRAGPLGRATVAVRGRGVSLPDPPTPFQQNPHVTVQLVNSLGNCWGVDYVTPARTNTDTHLLLREKP